MKKKILTLFIAACMCASMLTACGGESASTNVNSDASTTSDSDTKADETKTETKETQSEETETTKKSKPFGDISYVTKAPTCTEEGVRTFHGKDGNYTKPEPPTGHKFYNVPDEKGNTIDRRCEYCNAQDPDWSPEESTQNQ